MSLRDSFRKWLCRNDSKLAWLADHLWVPFAVLTAVCVILLVLGLWVESPCLIIGSAIGGVAAAITTIREFAPNA